MLRAAAAIPVWPTGARAALHAASIDAGPTSAILPISNGNVFFILRLSNGGATVWTPSFLYLQPCKSTRSALTTGVNFWKLE